MKKATMAGKPFSEPEETLVRMFKIKLKYFILKNSNLRTDEEIEQY